MDLTPTQSLAWQYINKYACERKTQALSELAHVKKMANVSEEAYQQFITSIKTKARIAFHFHPDRPLQDGTNVATSLLKDGLYKNQFETRISNGSVSAVRGGARDLWENKVFGGAFENENSPFHERPKYGALDLTGRPDGPSPRFGSCYLLLKPEVSKRATFTYLDSHQNPPQKGTLEEFDDIAAALLSEVFERDYALGEYDLSVRNFVTRLPLVLSHPIEARLKKEPSRNLNHYIETQVHGEVHLGRDVDFLVADSCFQNTEIGEVFSELCTKYHLTCLYHKGFKLAETEIPTDYRGPSMPSLAKAISINKFIDAYAIGKAAQQLRRNPDHWRERGSYEEVLQELKLMWHVLVKFG